eukprot:SAG25_NODE_905_length_4824_cov_5.405920_2_plen_876_part_00
MVATISLACPAGAGPGTIVQAQHNGVSFQVTVPPGVAPGMVFQVANPGVPPPPPPPAVQAPAGNMISIECPAGAGPGAIVQAEHNGVSFQVQIPLGISPGMVFPVAAPGPGSATEPQPQPQPQPIGESAMPSPLPGSVPGTAQAAQPSGAAAPTPPRPSDPGSSSKAGLVPVPATIDIPAKGGGGDEEEEEDHIGPAPGVSTDCCIRPSDIRIRFAADLKAAEEEGVEPACCVRKAHYEGFVIFGATILTSIMIIIQYYFVRRIQLTEGIPFPMFLEGTCMCDGKLCDDVQFTLNFTDEEDDTTLLVDDDAVQYWEAWNRTNQYILAAKRGGSLEPFEETGYCVQDDTNAQLSSKPDSDQLLCRGNLRGVMMVLLPVGDNEGRKSLDDNACWVRSRSGNPYGKVHDSDKDYLSDSDSQIIQSDACTNHSTNGCCYNKCDDTCDCNQSTSCQRSTNCGVNIKRQARQSVPRGGFHSGNTDLIGITIGAAIWFFLPVLASIIAWQDFINHFAPEGHKQTRYAAKERVFKQKFQRPSRLCFLMLGCHNGQTQDSQRQLSARGENWSDHVAGFAAEFFYYYLAMMPNNVFVSGFLQPGQSVAGYNETVLGKAVENAEYKGSGVWLPAMVHFDILLFVMFGCGCALIFCIIPMTIAGVCFGEVVKHSSGEANAKSGATLKKCALLLIPLLYVVAMIVLLVINVISLIDSISWDISINFFSIQFDFSNWTFEVPEVNWLGAFTAFVAALGRISILFTRFVNGLHTVFACSLCSCRACSLFSCRILRCKFMRTKVKAIKVKVTPSANTAAQHLRAGGTDEISVAEVMQEKIDEKVDEAKEKTKEKIEEKLELDEKVDELKERAEDELERIRDATFGGGKLQP